MLHERDPTLSEERKGGHSRVRTQRCMHGKGSSLGHSGPNSRNKENQAEPAELMSGVVLPLIISEGQRDSAFCRCYRK